MSSKRDDILKAALELIAESGFQGAPMARIIERAAVGVGTIYRYFEDKDALISGVNAEIERQLLIFLTKGFPTSGTVREQYLHLYQNLLRYCMTHPRQFRFLDQYIHAPRSFGFLKKRVHEGSVEGLLFHGLFRRGVDTGLLRNFPLSFHSAVTLGSIFNLARDHVCGLIQIEENQIKQAGEACWRAIASVPSNSGVSVKNPCEARRRHSSGP